MDNVRIKSILTKEVIVDLTSMVSDKCTNFIIGQLYGKSSKKFQEGFYVAILSNCVPAKIAWLNLYIKLLECNINPFSDFPLFEFYILKSNTNKDNKLDICINNYKRAKMNYDINSNVNVANNMRLIEKHCKKLNNELPWL